jgi:hypothetical protein
MMETAEIRRRLLQTIDRARRENAVHRQEADTASRHFDRFLSQVAAPIFRTLAQALRAEGHAFQVATPAGAIRLVSERSPEDFIELELDTTRRPVAILGRTRLARGRRLIDRESVFFQGPAVDQLEDDHVLEFLLRELEPFVER